LLNGLDGGDAAGNGILFETADHAPSLPRYADDSEPRPARDPRRWRSPLPVPKQLTDPIGIDRSSVFRLATPGSAASGEPEGEHDYIPA
jgi:hypothetical protein